MRVLQLIPAAIILFSAGPAVAQAWIEYASQRDFFSVNFPGEPAIRAFDYASEYAAIFPAREYSYTDGPNRYSVTVVDYTEAEAIHTARARDCPPDAHTACSGSASSGVGSWIVDTRGAISYAAWQFFQRDAELTFFSWNFLDLVDGRHLQLTNPDQSRTFAAIYMHEDRLYIVEATVPSGMPAPGLFQQSLRFLDDAGNSIRYESVYINGFPAPGRSR